MLRLMRKNASSWIIKILLGVVIIVFIFWGSGSYNDKSANRVALINGETISLDEYRDAYYNLLETYRQKFGKSLDDKMIKMLNLKKQAVNSLIDKTVILQEAKKLNIGVSKEELTNSLRNINVFQKNGAFNLERYRSVLKQNRLTPELFEISQKEAMVLEKLRAFVTDAAKISENEAYKWFNWNNATVNIDVVLIKPDNYKDIEPSDDEVKIFYERQKNNYQTDPKIKVRYIHFNPDSYKPKVNITEDEIKEYYERNSENYFTPKTVEARHILLKVNENAPPEIFEQKKQKALEVMNMAKDNQDFAELAKKHSEGPSKDQGGFLGAFEKNAMVKPFSDKAFSMKEGEISEPVLTRFGWHIIKVEKINQESTLSEKEATSDIRSKVIDERIKTLAYDEAVNIFDISVDGDDLIHAASEKQLEIKTTDFFTKKTPDKNIKDRFKFASEAFSLDVMDISDIIELNDGYYIIQVTEKIPEKIPPLNDVNEKVVADLVKEIQKKKAAGDANTILTAIKNGNSLIAESKKINLNVKSTGFIKRTDSLAASGFEQKITEVAFTLSSDNRYPEEIINGQKGFYIIEFKEKKAPEPDGFDKEKKKITDNLLQQKKYKTYDTWLSQIKEKCEIAIEKEFLE